MYFETASTDQCWTTCKPGVKHKGNNAHICRKINQSCSTFPATGKSGDYPVYESEKRDMTAINIETPRMHAPLEPVNARRLCYSVT